MRRALLSIVLLAGCRKTSSPPAPVADAAPNASASASAPSGAPSASASPFESMARTPTTIAADAGADDAPITAMAVTGISGGGIVLHARSAEGNKSDILARVLDAEGRVRGPARVLRRTSGSIESLSISARDDSVWVAWASNLDEKILAATVRTDPKLESVSAPITIVHEAFGSSQPNYWVQVMAGEGGRAVVATRGTSLPIACMFQAEQPGEKCTAGSYVVTRVGPDGKTIPLSRVPLDGNPIEIAPLVDIGGVVVVRAYAWHGGGVWSDQVAPYAESGNAKEVKLGSCRPGFEQAFTGDELITLCDLDYVDKGEKCPVPATNDMCPRIHRAKVDRPPYPDAGVPRGALVRSIGKACDAGHPVIKIVQADGTPLLIDPTKAGASVPQLAGWTGKVLLEIDTSNREGTSGPVSLKRRACRGNALVDLPN